MMEHRHPNRQAATGSGGELHQRPIETVPS
jgi:hypothetical protein